VSALAFRSGTLAAASDRRVRGVAVVYGQPSRELFEYGQRFTEVIERGSLHDAGDVLALYSHDSARVLGRTSSGTLELDDRADGLHFELSLPNTADGRDVHELVTRQDINGCSFGFRVEQDDWNKTAKPPQRTVTRGELFEISLVSMPAYPQTAVQARTAMLEPAAMQRLRLRAAQRRARQLALLRFGG